MNANSIRIKDEPSRPGTIRIALVAPTAIPARRANTIQVMKMAQALTILGHSVHLLSPFVGNSLPGDLPSWEMLADHYGLKHRFPISWLTAHPHLRRYDYSIKALLWARRWNCDLYYTRLVQSASLASLIGIPTLLEVHDLPAGRIGPMIFRLFRHGRGAFRLAAITRALATDLTNKLNIPPAGDPSEGAFTIIAPDGVDLERFENLPSPAESRRLIAASNPDCSTLDAQRFTAGYTGHLYAGRGTDLLLELASRLPDIQFLLVGGETEDVKRLRQLAGEARSTNLFLAGFVPNIDLPRYQAACDVLLMPYGRKVSASSGGDISSYLSPMKLFEYMACGRAILCSDLPPLREVLNPQNALILPPEDVDAWKNTLSLLQADPSRGELCARQAQEDILQYTWEKRASRLLRGLQFSQ
jgi:glycosyltransferase involved in cell wall biosynthesis